MNRNCFSELQKPRFYTALILTVINVDIVIFYKYMGLKSTAKKATDIRKQHKFQQSKMLHNSISSTISNTFFLIHLHLYRLHLEHIRYWLNGKNQKEIM